jgi:hypothetical protein
VLLPTPLVLEAVIRGPRERAERVAQEVLTSGLDEATLARLDALLDPRPAGKLTWIGWLRNAPQSPAPKNVPKLIERVRHLRAAGIDRARAGALPTPVFERMADEAARIATQHLAGLNPLRRRAILAAGAIALGEALADATLAMFEKLMASLGRAAERKTDEQAARSMRGPAGVCRVGTRDDRGAPPGREPRRGRRRESGMAALRGRRGARRGALRAGTGRPDH